MTIQNTQSMPCQQRGAALIVGLILLLVLTMLGISGMQSSTFELMQANNLQYGENAFEAADTGAERALRGTGLNTAIAVVVNETPVQPGSISTFETRTEFARATNVPKGLFSLGAGGGFQAYHFDIDSTGRSARNARTDLTQSFYVVGPGN